jgi:plasmid replication initiation protein
MKGDNMWVQKTKESMEQSDNLLARLENSFVFSARYKLNAREQKMLLYLISKLNPKNQTDFHKQAVTIAELKDLLTADDKKHGSFRVRLQDSVNNLVSCQISFPSTFTIDGIQFRNVINWFQYCVTKQDDNGQIYLEFAFSEILKPFLLNLKEYVKLNPVDILKMRSAYTIRMYQIFKAEFDRVGKIRQAKVTFSLIELKELLGIEDKYNSGDLKDFRNRVLNKIRDEVNEQSTSIYVDYTYVKSSKKVTGITWIVSDKKTDTGTPVKTKTQKKDTDAENFVPSQKDTATLSRAQLKAFEMLIELGVYEGIAFKQILPSIGGSEIQGFEDLFIQKAIQSFKGKSKRADAPTFVKWWHDLKVFEVGSDLWSLITEGVIEDKKKLEADNPEAFENRMKAKDMSDAAFEAWYRGRKKT